MRTHLATLLDDFRARGGDVATVTYRGNRRISVTYGELAALADRFAQELERRGIVRGERVVILGYDAAEWLGSFFGCMLRGVLIVPLDAAGSLDFTQRILAETTPRLVTGDALLLAKLDPSQERLTFQQVAALPAAGRAVPDPALGPDTPLQILFTSGTTAEPKGIVQTHRNVLASVTPIEQEIRKYLRYERLVHPLRMLHTLPLSHVFGQFMGLWIPPLLGMEVHFESRLQAERLMDTIRRERISVMAAVPRVLQMLRAALEADYPGLQEEIERARGEKAWRRWWRFRKIHRRLGFKFWAFVCGGAALPTELESFWNTLGLLIIQGYGMTESTALITLNHPFKASRGSIGKVLPGREVQIRDDGELVVRGEMVSTATWHHGAVQQAESPWLETGDLASRDASGQMRFLGRKGQVIVTSSGLNIHPDDVEAALNEQKGVQASAVVPMDTPAGPEPVAVLLFRGPQEAAQQAVVAANQRLAEFQQVRHWKIWPNLDLPRTSTGKIQRRKVAEWVNAQQVHAQQTESTAQQAHGDALLDAVLGITGAQPERHDDSARLAEDLQLDSLGRVQLQAELEHRMGVTLSENALEKAATLRDLRGLLGLQRDGEAAPVASSVTEGMGATTADSSPMAQNDKKGMGATTADSSATPQNDKKRATVPAMEAVSVPQTSVLPVAETRHDSYPRWPWWRPMRILRWLVLEGIVQPLVWMLAAPLVHRTGAIPTDKPMLLIANHLTIYDVPLVLYALPRRMRQHVAVAMAADILDAFRKSRQGEWVPKAMGPLIYLLVTGIFNVFPLPRSAGFRRSFQHAGEALDHGFDVLVFPEGRLSTDGSLQPFRAGIGLLVAESDASVLPIALAGLGEMQGERKRWFHPGALSVNVGTPITFAGNESAEQIAERLHAETERLLHSLA